MDSGFLALCIFNATYIYIYICKLQSVLLSTNKVNKDSKHDSFYSHSQNNGIHRPIEVLNRQNIVHSNRSKPI